jgi:hypothetical protein
MINKTSIFASVLATALVAGPAMAQPPDFVNPPPFQDGGGTGVGVGVGVGIGQGGAGGAGGAGGVGVGVGGNQDQSQRQSQTARQSTRVNTSAAAQSGSVSAAQSDQSQANVQGTHTAVNINETTTVHGSDLSRAVPDVIAPGLVAGLNTCMGSTSGGVSGSGFGLAFGTTWSDAGCERRNSSALLHSMGATRVAVALMCQDSNVAVAARDAGMPCPQDANKTVAVIQDEEKAVAAATLPRAKRERQNDLNNQAFINGSRN